MIKKGATYLLMLLSVLSMSSCGIKASLNDRPNLSSYNINIPERTVINDSTFSIGNNFLLKNRFGLWEMYVEGDPLELGLISGSLSRELVLKQERVFMEKIYDLVPSQGRRNFLRKFLSWYNRKMYLHIKEEFKAEIYGISRFSSSEYNELATPYLRSLYLHGAHDIGHALQDLMLVGCSSFAVWGEKTPDGNLLIGRNFDFYAGDEFAEEKIIAFVNPSEGHNFMSVSWGGMIGVVSGMNDQGLTVTINAGKSKIPLVAKTPISIVTREILQYAATIEEAVAIAKEREVFVSEAIFIGSAKDGRAALIEMSPTDFGVYEVTNSEQLICSNHFQSDVFKNDRRNIKQIEESHSKYRFTRMEELLAEDEKISPTEAVAILRNKKGVNDTILGFGNEKALNQLLAHHGIVFQPEDLRVWISSNPYQLGEFVSYDLNEVFKDREGNPAKESMAILPLTIAKDPFVDTPAFKNYEDYRILERLVENAIERDNDLLPFTLLALQQKNPDYWKAYYLTGKYYNEKGYYAAALRAFETANKKVIPTLPDKQEIERNIYKLKRKLNR
ncbi:C45 family autoproteolytic acyltransferase/hydolase [Constantimarinum furrinae]|uniref:Acyl-CoA--6-aminopenicillanic acid acyl-transferase n=1 Tax=Constantimarinum furrinae TaxID=2562285 RepID=A0A7G8PTY0_9FLAO|nr:C45 family peptidase [Constantimarinum furrinae]QNJ97796.1 acyl-CoA--6-aminopenicillanic acid acyl-transferase [Constantimarinum furrinae]